MKKLFLLFATSLLLFSCSDSSSDNSPSEAPDSNTETNEQDNQEEDLYTWIYADSKDEMTDKKEYIARIISSDIASLSPPYEEGAELSMSLVTSGSNTNVLIKSSTGQINDDYDNPTLFVRFDDEKPERWSVVESSDNDPTIRFIENDNQFVKKLKNSKKVKISVEFFQDGIHVFNFKTEGLKWEH
jgi:hypothetical protein